jgi:proteasome lid subunit RPN8/RPN11
MVDEMVAHAREEAPNECCGIVAASEGRAVAVHRVANAARSPFRYVMEPMEQFRVQDEIEEAGLDLGAIYHSHTRSDPVPSQTDINLANPLFGDPLYVIVGVKAAEPDVRAFRIVDGQVSEATLEIED